jgi:type VI secretion system secreted protein VgrG
MLARTADPRAEERISSVSLIEPSSAPFELSAGPYESPALVIVSLRGREAISEPFSFDITVVASLDVDDSTIETDLLGAPACLVMQAGASAPRYVRGVIAAVAAQSSVHGRRAVYRLRVVPALWLLKKRTTSRIFQDKTVPEIVAAVLDKAGVAHKQRLLGKHRPRSYCVQHRESDFAFVERLLAEEGLFYAFDHGGPEADTEVMVLSDSAHLYPTIEGDPELAYRPHEGAAGMALDEHHVQRFDLRRSLRPTSVLRRGYDFRRPSQALVARARLEEHGNGDLEQAEVYEHHEEDEEPNVRQETVIAELEQQRARVEVGRGVSGCRRLVPGARFTLCDHDLGRLDGEYVVTRLKHEGRAPQAATAGEPVYTNTFECVPAAVTARPPRPARSIQQVTETALVVGPAGQEIYTDEYGRVKVQFHWDREGLRDEDSSCWIRVAQAWSGAGWGSQFIPRVGMEVIVTFLGGDVDRPMILGCVPNAANCPPFPLPSARTQSGIRTRSTPGGGGSNEIRFDDAAGREQVYVHAQRNLDELVENDHTRTVRGQEAIRVSKDRTLEIAGDHVRTVQGSEVVDIGKHLILHIAGRQIINIDGEDVDGDASSAAELREPRETDAAMGEGAGSSTDAYGPNEGGGRGSGGGGAQVTDWSNKGKKDKESVMTIKGGGKIDSPDGLTLQVGGASIEIKDNTITLTAATIKLGATTISIAASGETKVTGAPIRLN